MRNDKADLEKLYNALLAAKVNVESALREARLLVGMPEPPSTTEPLIAAKRAQEAIKADQLATIKKDMGDGVGVAIQRWLRCYWKERLNG